MDIFERFNSKFGGWYERLFGSEDGELRPKDVLRKLTAAMEDNRKEGLDGGVYVPNKYIVELAVDNADEREYLLSFLDEEELVAVLQKFMAQNGYKTRGPLDFTILEMPEAERALRPEKLRIRVRFEKEAPHPQPLSQSWERGGSAAEGVRVAVERDDLPTVASVVYDDAGDDEPGTVPAVAWAALAITSPEGRKSHFSLTKPTVQIGRSRNAGNDLILDTDGMVSKAHARLERERDGAWTLYDLGSTNGITVGGTRVSSNRALTDGDEVVIGETHLVFQQADARPPAPAFTPAVSPSPPRRARLIAADGEAFVLASETLIGRAVTSDIVLADPSVATKHARVIAPDAATYFLEDLSGHAETRLNTRVLFPGQRLPLTDGDRLTFGTVEMRFAAGTSA